MIGDIIVSPGMVEQRRRLDESQKARDDRDGISNAQLVLLQLICGDHIVEQHIHTLMSSTGSRLISR